MKLRKPLSDAIFVELFRVTCAGQVPTVIMAVLFSLVALNVSIETGDFWVKLISIAGLLAGTYNILLMSVYLRQLRVEIDNMERLKKADRFFAVGSLSFGLLVGLLGARTFFIASESMQILMIALLFGYAAGVAMRGFVRLRLCLLSIGLATLPVIGALMLRGGGIYWSLVLLSAVFLYAAIESVGYIHGNFIERFALQQKFASMARNDELTGLFNRLALREGFEVVARERAAGTLLAVHCLDLDQFKPVNDTYGHPVGDELLKQVSQRLGRVLRKDDFAARVGGDEFIVVQTGIDHEWQAGRLAERIIESVTAPYSIESHKISIGTSIGISLAPAHQNEVELDELVATADAALYQVKRENRGSFLIGAALEHLNPLPLRPAEPSISLNRKLTP